MPDNAPDHCPSTPGVAANYGCPADWEVVIVHGWWEPDDPYDWITNYAICPDGTLQTSYDQCAEYGVWGAFATAYYVGGTYIATLEKDDGYEPQEEPCQGTACWTPGDWVAWCSQHQGTAEEWIVDMTPECQHYGFNPEAALMEALLAVAAAHPFETCIVAAAGTTIVGIWTKGTAGQWIVTGSVAAGVSCTLLFGGDS